MRKIYKGSSNYRLVMHDRLVTTCTDILKILPPAGLGVNKIIKQTSKGPKHSPDRTHVIEAIKTLEKAKIASHERWSPGKPKVIKLTALGNEIKELMNELNLFRQSYKKLEDIWHQWFLSKERSEMNVKLSMNLDSGYAFVKTICEKNILLALLHRYSSIHYEYELNQVVDAILINILSTELKYQLLEKGKQIVENEDPNAAVFNEAHRCLLLSSIMEPIIRDIHTVYTKDFYISSWKSGERQVKNFLSSLLSVAKISKTLAGEATTFAEYDNSDKLKISHNKTYDKDYLEHLEHVGEVLREFRPQGYHDLPNSKEYRNKDREELISLYKNFT
jgi:hypothetical protein